ncbi:ADP-dependent (S)-NAD(P)H-hydrate dehydratase [Andreprevotia sp. IGB-42]|uniref:NAD(P)H-hydrate dehydratase n=1 Tax=Andreprevotia sp. IGB-42 TaxID=2497473 RepID=UPI00135AEECD|nr:NAD(P)H-hydrate dehydratase [Andreprevotia sp. IGB-42]KAF0813646.1 ADP-dependent (S)-NAD(P)H-hydrate dehydratase [Andreprevotia sp. IGB-42]
MTSFPVLLPPCASRDAACVINAALLAQWPLPQPAADADKAGRGHILIVAGSPETPGAAVLAATAALRAGAGKLVIATAASVATAIGIAMPEARVIAIPETSRGGITLHAAKSLQQAIGMVDAAVIGPGMPKGVATSHLVALLREAWPVVPLVLDATAMDALPAQPDLGGPLALTPHAGEMAHLTGHAKADIEHDAASHALHYANAWSATLALKGGSTHIASPDGRLWRLDDGDVGLATSGSGDVLAGLVGGLLARGADVEQALAWATWLHGQAGKCQAQRQGPLGYLARELAAEIPRLLQVPAESHAAIPY